MLEGPSKQLKQIFQIEHNIVKNLNWPEANQWPRIWTRGYRETNPGSGQSGTRTGDRWIASQTRWPLGHAASSTTVRGLELLIYVDAAVVYFLLLSFQHCWTLFKLQGIRLQFILLILSLSFYRSGLRTGGRSLERKKGLPFFMERKIAAWKAQHHQWAGHFVQLIHPYSQLKIT